MNGTVLRLVIALLCAEVFTEISATNGHQESGNNGNLKNSSFRCYTCLGRDYENCMVGDVQCAGACWKLVDDRHSLISKGCTAEMKKSGVSEEMDTGVRLPWTDNAETIKGMAYFCTSDWCNGADHVLLGSTLLALCVAAVYAWRL